MKAELKKTFVKLRNLLDVSYEGETAEEAKRWKQNVLNSVGTEGYCLDDSGDEFNTKELAADEVAFVDLQCYNFMGSAYEQERFYSANWITVQEVATGTYYALETEDIYE